MGQGQTTAGTATAWRGWPLWAAPNRLVAYMVAIDLVALGACLAVLVTVDGTGRQWWATGLLVLVAIAFEEGMRRAARLQIRLSAQLRTDMTSVWAVAGAVALSPSAAVVLLGAVLAYDWFRVWRPAGEALYRKLFVAATFLLACLAAGAVARAIADRAGTAPWALTDALAVVGAIVCYTIVNRALVTVVLVLSKVPRRDMVGSMHDNLIELATLCLGGLTALAVLFEPWLVVLVIAPMVTLQRGALVRELEAAAMTDGKTGLLNAMAWEQLAQREMTRAEREQQPLGVLLIDIDRFKTVNDRYGHLVGDRVLRGIGKTLQDTVREYDGVGRFGGEEFVAVLPGADEATALTIAERVRATVHGLHLDAFVDEADLIGPAAPDGAGRVSVSIGVACLPVDGVELSDLLHGADRALYLAKSSGRNQVRLAFRDDGVSEPVPAAS